MTKIRALLAAMLITLALRAAPAADPRYAIHFPDLPGYQTLKCDFHTHTVFSDGSVWPPVRVDEAWRQGLNVIAISDHIEYQPHKDDVPTNFERSYELAAGPAQAAGVLLVKAAEITRDTPPGHFNALFLSDIAKIDTPEFVDAVGQANEQGAFVFWNHHAWKGEEQGQWLDVHKNLYEKKWFHGMEVANGDEYYPTAHRWCLEKNLTMLGNSDIHAPDLGRKSEPDNHRTLTLVFAKERSLDAVKDALVAGRTAVWLKDQLIGRREWLEPLFQACIRVDAPTARGKDSVTVTITNTSDVDVQLQRTGNTGPTDLTLPAGTTSMVKISTDEPGRALELEYTATNWLIAPGEGLPAVLKVAGP